MQSHKSWMTYPILGVPSTSLSLSGPDRFLAKVVGIIGRGAIGRAWKVMSGTTAPPGKEIPFTARKYKNF